MDPGRRPRSSRRLAFAAALACALAAVPAGATLYKWTDANGRVVYADQPPGGGVKYEIVGTAPPPDNPNAVRDMANKEAELRKVQKDRADQAAKAEKTRADAAKRADICEQARAAVRMYQSDNLPLVSMNAKGEQVVVDAAERQRRLAEQQRLAKEYCSG